MSSSSPSTTKVAPAAAVGAPNSSPSSSAAPHYWAVDVIRVTLTVYVCAFHALSVLTWILTLDETDALLRHPVGRLIPLGYTCVDGFLVITGMLTTEQLLRRYSNGRSQSVGEVADAIFRRLLSVYLPLLTVIAGYAWTHRHGKFPLINARNEGALLIARMTSPMNVTEELGHAGLGYVIPPNPLLMRDSGAALWWWQLLGISNMAPFGGLLEQTWSLSVQLQWYLWLPLLPYLLHAPSMVLCYVRGTGATRPSLTPRTMANVALTILAFSTCARVVAHRHLSQFNPSSFIGFAMHFWWYASTLTRVGPLAGGALCAVLSTPELREVREWLTGAVPLSLHARSQRFSVLLLGAVNIAACALINAFWKDLMHADDEGSPQLHHEAMYVLLRPGGTLSATAYACIIFVAMHGLRLTPPTVAVADSEPAADDARPPPLTLRPEPEPAAAATEARSPPASSSSRRRGSGVSSPVAAPTDTTGLRKRGGGGATPAVRADVSTRDVSAVVTSGDVAPAARRSPPPRRGASSLCDRLVTAAVPLTYMVYLVNSTVYEDLFGWTQRLHPCPAILTPHASAHNVALIHNGAWSVALAANASQTLPWLWERLYEAEDAATDAYTSLARLMAGPADLYCSDGGDGVECTGLCFSNEHPDVSSFADASCVLTHNCSIPTHAGRQIPRETLTVSPRAWVQWGHYTVVGLVITWVAAFILFMAVEAPLGALLMHPRVRWLVKPIVLLHAAAILIVSVPAHIYFNMLVLQNVTPAFETQVMHTPFPHA